MQAFSTAVIRFPCVALLLAVLCVGCTRGPSGGDSGRVELVYWMTWTGFEAAYRVEPTRN